MSREQIGYNPMGGDVAKEEAMKRAAASEARVMANDGYERENTAIEIALNGQAMAIEDLHSNVRALAQRLMSVLQPEDTERAESRGPVDMKGSSPVRVSIEEAGRHVHMIRSEVEDILRRLEA